MKKGNNSSHRSWSERLLRDPKLEVRLGEEMGVAMAMMVGRGLVVFRASTTTVVVE